MKNEEDWQFDCTSRSYPSHYDMADPKDLPAGVSDPTRKALNVLYDALYSHYNEASLNARKGQRKHNTLTACILWLGTSAIVIAVVQLLLKATEQTSTLTKRFFELDPMSIIITGVEIVIILIALVLGVLFVVRKVQSNWLVNRHIAEKLRLLKFRSLLSPKLWCGENGTYPDDFEGWKEEVIYQRDRIVGIDHQELAARMRTEKVRNPPPFICAGYPERDLRDLIEYYLDKRITYQKNWYCSKIRQLQGQDRFIRKLPEGLFYLSFVAVMFHFILNILHIVLNILHLDILHLNIISLSNVIEQAKEVPNPYENISMFLVALAVVLPVIGFAIKTYRSSRQLAPVSSIFISKYSALENLEERIRDELAKAPVPWESIYRLLYQSETLLANEHHEWLILMHEQDFSP